MYRAVCDCVLCTQSELKSNIINIYGQCIVCVRCDVYASMYLCTQGTCFVGATKRVNVKINQKMLAYSFSTFNRDIHEIIFRTTIYRAVHAVHQIICVGWMAGCICLSVCAYGSVWNVPFLDSSSSFFPFITESAQFSLRHSEQQQQQQQRELCVFARCMAIYWIDGCICFICDYEFTLFIVLDSVYVQALQYPNAFCFYIFIAPSNGRHIVHSNLAHGWHILVCLIQVFD